ncbi:metallophosphoesterase [Soehngenia longivitae]|uniref:Phosphoesterase n=1 Tax=Soehngenia longivitae TaxID=2562294 RepID=A0A4Z0D7B9_9FIRM|nr:metallophosphoesterase family protein [Soehngenia longivitae]TFZ40798.1 metallophosphoesterase [Soehngenia longivitae]
MRVGIFSDIHGNKYALEEALIKMDEKRIDVNIFCGDAIGYYYYHNEVINILRNMKDIICVLGNHDKMFIDIIDKKRDAKSYFEKYGSSIYKFLNSITEENIYFLRSLPVERNILIDDLKIKIIHGSPWKPIDEYVYPNSDFSRYSHVDFDYVFQGHTHYPMIVKQGNCEIINPGSIGQPRDGGFPSFVVFDTSKKLFEFVSFEYNIDQLLEDIQRVGGEPIYLSNVLRRPLNEK